MNERRWHYRRKGGPSPRPLSTFQASCHRREAQGAGPLSVAKGETLDLRNFHFGEISSPKRRAEALDAKVWKRHDLKAERVESSRQRVLDPWTEALTFSHLAIARIDRGTAWELFFQLTSLLSRSST